MKKSAYLNVIRGRSEYLLHNTLNGTIAKAKCIRTRSIIDNLDKEVSFKYDESNAFHKFLYDLGMIVRDGVDERNLLNYRFHEANRDELEIILFVTRQCNFRCVYCYEKHENKCMRPELYVNLAKAIKKEVDTKRYKSVLLSFFGGEPMLEYDTICAFMENMRKFASEANITVSGGMTTNAHLLTYEKLKRLVELNVLSFQITLDGLKETHDSNRLLVGGGATWERIIQNLKDAKNSDLGFEITLRTNISANSADMIENYLRYISSNFANDNRFKYHFEAIKDLGGDIDPRLYDNNNDRKVVEEIISTAKEVGLQASLFSYGFMPFGYMCYASKNNNLAVDTDGTLRKCTVDIYSEENAVGILSDKGFEIEDIKICDWTSYDLPEECYDCKILPLCFGRKCPLSIKTLGDCDKSYCSTILAYYESSLLYYYKLDGFPNKV